MTESGHGFPVCILGAHSQELMDWVTTAYRDQSKMSSSIKLICKGTLRQALFCLSPPPLLGLGGLAILFVLNLVRYRVLNSCRISKYRQWVSGRGLGFRILLETVLQQDSKPPPPPSHQLSVLWQREVGGGGWAREKVRGATVHKAGLKTPTWLTVSPVYKHW
jgi:hypothetical protein